MPTVQTVLDAIDRIAPSEWAFSFDKVGLQVGESTDTVERAAVALDPSTELIAFARHASIQLVVCHHPLIWDPLAAVNGSTRSGRLAAEFIRSGIAFIGAHTNWDSAPGGINDILARKLGLKGLRPFGSAAEIMVFKLTTFLPAESKDRMIDALAGAGAGTIGAYERCAFTSSGEGTFVGGPGTHPKVGQAGKIEKTAELRLEMRVPSRCLDSAIAALRSAHPYEEPAYDIYPLRSERPQPPGRIGTLEAPMTLQAFARHIDAALNTRCWSFGEGTRPVQSVAVCGGAADGEWVAAQRAGADVFVTGEVRHHVAVEASESGMAIIAAGHHATENPGAIALGAALAPLTPGIEWLTFEPSAGDVGRLANS